MDIESDSLTLDHHYLACYKPFGILSQFSDEGNRRGLNALGSIPVGVYPVGRLDADSEGLLILTDDKRLNARLLEPGRKMVKSYLVQVEGEVSDEALENLAKGVSIRIKKQSYQTLPSQVVRIEEPALPERDPPIRKRAAIPTSWIRLEITEGKNRQVRRMCAAVGFPVLRLVRERIGSFCLEQARPGDIWSLDPSLILQILKQ